MGLVKMLHPCQRRPLKSVVIEQLAMQFVHTFLCSTCVNII